MFKCAALRTLLSTVLFLSLFAGASAQNAGGTGVLVGRVVSTANGLPVIGVTLTIAGQSGETNLNGVFRIEDVPVGEHSLTVDKAGFQRQSVTGVAISTVEIAKLDLAVAPVTADAPITMAAFGVAAEVVRSSGVGLLSERQRAIAVSDSIGSDQMSRLGFNDAAQAMKAVTGASVVDGKYVYIRGLGERYS
jgi:hypothetical protein